MLLEEITGKMVIYPETHIKYKKLYGHDAESFNAKVDDRYNNYFDFESLTDQLQVYFFIEK